MPPPPDNNVGKELLATLIKLLKDLPPLSIGIAKKLNHLGGTCLKKCQEFLSWSLSHDSHLDNDCRRMALEVLFLICLQEGTVT